MALIKSRNDNEMSEIQDNVKRTIELKIRGFMKTNDSEYTLISSLTAPQRRYAHNFARSLKLMSKSRGKGMNREVTVYKRELSTIIQRDAMFHLTPFSNSSILSLMQQAPLTTKEKVDIVPHHERDRSGPSEVIQREPNRSVNRLVTGVPVMPSSSRRAMDAAMVHQRLQLPIHAQREAIVQAINDNPVVIICGDTGSGKTTQVPQYIMEYHERSGRACRIICSQPRRIAAVAMGERVALERNCKVGTEVGYQVRHESVANSRTVLTYITNGILLRTLMCGDSSLATVTHLIIDEVHIRDRAADFILIALREALAKYRSLRLVLISASLDMSPYFSKYFNGCPVITVTSSLHPVTEYFLEDILKLTDYKTKEMEKYRNDYKKRGQQDKVANEWIELAKENKTGQSPPSKLLGKSKSQENDMDRYLENAIKFGCEESMKQVLHLIKNNGASVDHQHPSTRVTPLIAACINGHLEFAEELLNLGASLDLTIQNNKTAYDCAQKFNHHHIMGLLTSYMNTNFVIGPITDGQKSSTIPDDKYILLESYKHCFKDNIVNADLILSIINKIQALNQIGAVLIFLPGYEDIVQLMDKLSKREPKPNENLLKLVALHSKMETSDQKVVFHQAPPGMRKVILSTNIAESCITLQDVVFVIDTGLVRESSYERTDSSSRLHSAVVRCSQNCVRQRRARAGRSGPGFCYHLFSNADYQAMPTERTPEMKRTPIHNLCLQTKLLAQSNIADFLAKAIDPPPFSVMRDSVKLLKDIDALEQNEDLSLLGQHLVELPLPPHLGKALLYAVLLKCLDPVLTIVAMLSYDDPFETPETPAQRRELQAIRRRLAGESGSDHCVLLQVFMKWLARRSQGKGRDFCREHHLCEARLEMVHSHRAHLLTQLRAMGFVRAKDTGSDVRELNQNSDKMAVIKAALTGGHYPNLVRVDREMNTLRTHDQVSVTFHPSSVLRGNSLQKHVPSTLASDWIIFEELSRAGSACCNVRVCSLVSDVTVAIFAGPARFPMENFIDPETDCGSGNSEDEDENSEEPLATLKVDNWTVFRLQTYVARNIIMIRNKWHAVLAKRLRTPYKPLAPNDELVLEALKNVLTNEEEKLGLESPNGIGAKPLLINNHDSEHSPLGRKPYDASKQLAAIDLNRHANQRRHFDPNENGGTGVSSSNNCSVSPSLPQENNSSSNKAFFVIRPGNMRALDMAHKTNLWHFNAGTEMRVKNAFREGKTVILLISLQAGNNISHFHGCARLKSDHCDWSEAGGGSLIGHDQNLSPAGGPGGAALPIEWLHVGSVSVNSLRHFCSGVASPSDFLSRLMSCRDGQEIEPSVGETVCYLWEVQMPPHKGPPLAHHGYGGHQGGNSHGRPIRAPPQPYYGGPNNPYGPNMRQNM